MRSIAAAAPLGAVLALAACAVTSPTAGRSRGPACRCAPGDACWPTDAEWQRFGATLHGELERPRSPFEPCRSDATGAACAAALRAAANPFALQDDAGATQSTGWLGAWTAAPSAWAVAATDAADVAAAVSFAREHRLRLVVKGTGHDYLGRSSAPGSLLVWTHALRGVTVHDAFVPRGCPATEPGVPAVTLEAGVRWMEAYREVAVKRGRYVQGGGCTSVGAAGGFLQGGGFGSWSKKFGTSAASALELEVVTADGVLRTTNACQERDLFWALRGGGGGTFGVVTKVTLRTHPLPATFGVVTGSISAKGDAAFLELLVHLLAFFRERLGDERWGEQVRVRGDDVLEVSMNFVGMTADDARRLWKPFTDWVGGRRDAFTAKLDFVEIPGRRLWDEAFLAERFPEAIAADARPGGVPGGFWWAGDGEQVSMYWWAYGSRWVPRALFEERNAKAFAAALFEASRHATVGLHFNKGQAGAAPEAVARGRETSMNPAVYDAAALAIVAEGARAVPGVAGHEPDAAKAAAARERVAAAMEVIRAATPGAGTYANEADFFEPSWRQELWGANYDALARIKEAVDPGGLFTCHHCVGSERWSDDGMCEVSGGGGAPSPR